MGTSNRLLALILLVITLAPLGFWVYVIGTADPTYAAAVADEDPELVLKRPVLLGTLIAAFVTIGLIIFYLFHLYVTARVAPGKRALWLFLIVFVNILAMPLYWYYYVWREEQSGAA